MDQDTSSGGAVDCVGKAGGEVDPIDQWDRPPPPGKRAQGITGLRYRLGRRRAKNLCIKTTRRQSFCETPHGIARPGRKVVEISNNLGDA